MKYTASGSRTVHVVAHHAYIAIAVSPSGRDLATLTGSWSYSGARKVSGSELIARAWMRAATHLGDFEGLVSRRRGSMGGMEGS